MAGVGPAGFMVYRVGRAGRGRPRGLFLAHADTHTEATAQNPIKITGGTPVSFEVRVRDGGTGDKAGWQTSLSIDACEFETPSDSAITLGNMFGGAIPVRRVMPAQDNTIEVTIGQVMLAGTIKSEAGLLATVTLTPKAQRSCPSEFYRRRLGGDANWEDDKPGLGRTRGCQVAGHRPARLFQAGACGRGFDGYESRPSKS